MQLIRERREPVLDVSPHHVRMASAYRDRAGRYHLVADYIDASLGTIHSFEAALRYYTGEDACHWRDQGVAVSRSLPGGPLFSYDGFGTGSPHLLLTGNRVLLFYSGRSGPAPGEAWNGLALPGEAGFIGADILLAVAKTDETGAVGFPFEKTGPVVARRPGDGVLRLDDPCALVRDGSIHLFYKILRLDDGKRRVSAGHAVAPLGNPTAFTADEHYMMDDGSMSREDSPVRGGEMPRVFVKDGVWQLFWRIFAPKSGTVWKHFESPDLGRWTLVNDALFGCVTPGRGATDMMLIRGENGVPTRLALASGMEEENLKLYLYRLVP